MRLICDHATKKCVKENCDHQIIHEPQRKSNSLLTVKECWTPLLCEAINKIVICVPKRNEP